MLAMRPSVPVLASLRLFQGIDEADLAAMAATMRSRRHRAGEVICHQGDPGDVLYVIEGGSVKLVLPSPRGDEAILAILRRQGFFGQLALLDRGFEPATAIALEPTETVIVPRATFMALIADHASARDVVLAALARDLRRLAARIEALHFLDVPGRVADTLIGLAKERGRPLSPTSDTPSGAIRIDGPLTQGDIAGMTHSSRQSVNQALAALGGEGIVRVERDGIVILAPDRLASRARA